MAHAVLTLDVPDEIWIGDLSRRYPDAQFRVLAATASDDGGVAVVELVAAKPELVVSEIVDYESVTDFEVLDDDDDGTLLQIETQMWVFLESAQRSGVPIETPFSVQNGEIRWELTVSRDRLSALSDELGEAGINFTVESIYQQVDSEQLLTDRQWAILQTALEKGYYDTPRGCTQEELAAEVGFAKSTCSETLHRAEERIIKRLIDERNTARGIDAPRRVVVG